MSGVRMQIARVLSQGTFALFMTTMHMSLLVLNCLTYLLTLGIPIINAIGCAFVSGAVRRMTYRSYNQSSIRYLKEEV